MTMFVWIVIIFKKLLRKQKSITFVIVVNGCLVFMRKLIFVCCIFLMCFSSFGKATLGGVHPNEKGKTFTRTNGDVLAQVIVQEDKIQVNRYSCKDFGLIDQNNIALPKGEVLYTELLEMQKNHVLVYGFFSKKDGYQLFHLDLGLYQGIKEIQSKLMFKVDKHDFDEKKDGVISRVSPDSSKLLVVLGHMVDSKKDQEFYKINISVYDTKTSVLWSKQEEVMSPYGGYKLKDFVINNESEVFALGATSVEQGKKTLTDICFIGLSKQKSAKFFSKIKMDRDVQDHYKLLCRDGEIICAGQYFSHRRREVGMIEGVYTVVLNTQSGVAKQNYISQHETLGPMLGAQYVSAGYIARFESFYIDKIEIATDGGFVFYGKHLTVLGELYENYHSGDIFTELAYLIGGKQTKPACGVYGKELVVLKLTKDWGKEWVTIVAPDSHVLYNSNVGRYSNVVLDQSKNTKVVVYNVTDKDAETGQFEVVQLNLLDGSLKKVADYKETELENKVERFSFMLNGMMLGKNCLYNEMELPSKDLVWLKKIL